jgi:LysR family transcriptional activator of mexEF-oprN operon
MNRNDMRKVDLNLLIIFEALMHERHLTRASEKLFLGQRRLTLRIGL